jgi:hypothetical protein
MKIINTIVIKYTENEKNYKAWLGIYDSIDNYPNAEIIEERPMVFPDEGKILRSKKTGRLCKGFWVQTDDELNYWEEIDE